MSSQNHGANEHEASRADGGEERRLVLHANLWDYSLPIRIYSRVSGQGVSLP